MTEKELEILHLTAFRDIALALAESMIEDPSQYLAGMASREQQIKYYHDCLEAAERYDQQLGELTQ